MEVNNKDKGVIEVVNGYEVRQHFYRKAGRWYVWLPKHSGLRERFKKKDRMLRSHYVYCQTHNLDGIDKSFVIHHSDHDRTNDTPENLQMLSIADHNLLHESDTPDRSFLGRKHTPETIEKMKESAAIRGNNGVWSGAKKGHFESTKLIMSEKSSGINNSNYRHDIDGEAIRRCYESVKSIDVVSRIFGCSKEAVRNRINGEHSQDWKNLSDIELMAVFERNSRNCHKTALELNAPQTSLWRRINQINKVNNES